MDFGNGGRGSCPRRKRPRRLGLLYLWLSLVKLVKVINDGRRWFTVPGSANTFLEKDGLNTPEIPVPGHNHWNRQARSMPNDGCFRGFPLDAAE